MLSDTLYYHRMASISSCMVKDEGCRINNREAMTNLQTVALLEAIKIITENAKSKEEVIEALTRIQDKIKEPNAQPSESTR